MTPKQRTKHCFAACDHKPVGACRACVESAIVAAVAEERALTEWHLSRLYSLNQSLTAEIADNLDKSGARSGRIRMATMKGGKP